MLGALCQPHGVRGVSICNAVLILSDSARCMSLASNIAGARIGRTTAQRDVPDLRSSACQICIKRHIDDKYDFTWQFIPRKYNC